MKLNRDLKPHIRKIHPLVCVRLDLHRHVREHVLPHRCPRLGRVAEHGPAVGRRGPAELAARAEADVAPEDHRARARVKEAREGRGEGALRGLVEELEEVRDVDRGHVARERRERACLPEARWRRGRRGVRGGRDGQALEERGVEHVAREEGHREARGRVAEELVADVPIPCPRRALWGRGWR